MIVEEFNKSTGEYMKPYELPAHKKVKTEIERQIKFVNTYIKDSNGEKISNLSGDNLVSCMYQLAAMYEYLGTWLANERLNVDDLKSVLELKIANEYISFKQEEKETNETARMKAKIACQSQQEALDAHRHGYAVVETWKKSIGRYHDSVRSQLSYEKSLASMNR